MQALLLLFFTTAVAYSQTTTAEPPQNQTLPETPAAPATPPSTPPVNAKGQSRNRSVLKPTPGQLAIKPKDYRDATGYWHPFARMGRFVGYDQKAIWTSPFHTSKRDAKWWLIFGGATGGLIAADKYIANNAPNPRWLQHLGDDVSYLGEAYTLLPITAAFYFGGTALHSDHFRETGLLAFEALADSTVEMLALKSVFDRQRPLEGHGDGEFEASTSPRYDSSFPSGHAIETMTLASVMAHEYPHKRWVQVLAYAYAAGVIGSRLAANRHFPGDVVAGGALGWFTGDYVYGHRHNPALDKNPTITDKIIEHLHFGFGI
jgi:membrane-associated phospholipid phosphatase